MKTVQPESVKQNQDYYISKLSQPRPCIALRPVKKLWTCLWYTIRLLTDSQKMLILAMRGMFYFVKMPTMWSIIPEHDSLQFSAKNVHTNQIFQREGANYPRNLSTKNCKVCTNSIDTVKRKARWMIWRLVSRRAQLYRCTMIYSTHTHTHTHIHTTHTYIHTHTIHTHTTHTYTHIHTTHTTRTHIHTHTHTHTHTHAHTHTQTHIHTNTHTHNTHIHTHTHHTYTHNTHIHTHHTTHTSPHTVTVLRLKYSQWGKDWWSLSSTVRPETVRW